MVLFLFHTLCHNWLIFLIFYKALGMVSAWSAPEKPRAVSLIAARKSWYKLPVLIHCYDLNMKYLRKANDTVWGSFGTFKKEGLACGSRLLGKQAWGCMAQVHFLFCLQTSCFTKKWVQTAPSYLPPPCLPITLDFVLSNHELKSATVTSSCFVHYLIKGCGISRSWQSNLLET